MKTKTSFAFVICVLLLNGCRGSDHFDRVVSPAPEPIPIPISEPEKESQPAQPLPEPMKYPLPKAKRSENQCWENRDLRFLKGCWHLGEKRAIRIFKGDQPYPGTLSALLICFDDRGNSTKSELNYYFDGESHICNPPEKAWFNSRGQLIIASQQQVECTNSFSFNGDDDHTCNYLTNGTADCIYRVLSQADHPDNGMHLLLKRASGSTVTCQDDLKNTK